MLWNYLRRLLPSSKSIKILFLLSFIALSLCQDNALLAPVINPPIPESRVIFTLIGAGDSIAKKTAEVVLDEMNLENGAFSQQDGLKNYEGIKRADQMKDWNNVSFAEVNSEGKRAFYIIMFAVVSMIVCCLLVRFSLIQSKKSILILGKLDRLQGKNFDMMEGPGHENDGQIFL